MLLVFFDTLPESQRRITKRWLEVFFTNHDTLAQQPIYSMYGTWPIIIRMAFVWW